MFKMLSQEPKLLGREKSAIIMPQQGLDEKEKPLAPRL